MLINLTENLKKTNALKRVYKGRVVENNDPKKLQRVKVIIEGFMEAPVENLPWCFPKRSSFLGGSNESGTHSVPEIDSYLEIRFPFEDPYSPFYDGYWIDEKTKLSEFADDPDYPDVFGWKDSSGNIYKVNKVKETMKLTHSSGLTIEVDKDGNFNLNAPGDISESLTNKMLEVAQEYMIEAGTDIILKSGTLFKGEAPIVELGENPSFHATLSENVIAYNDVHTHPAPQAPAGTLPTLPPSVPMSAKAGTALDVKALKIFLAGNS